MAKNDTLRLSAKIKKQNQQIRQLKKEVEGYHEGSAELSRVLDSILVQVAIKWGEQVADGVWEATLPQISVGDSCRNYAVSARAMEDGGYVIRVAARGEEN